MWGRIENTIMHNFPSNNAIFALKWPTKTSRIRNKYLQQNKKYDMKKTISLWIILASFSNVSAQITQEKADEIVLKRMSQEKRSHIVYAKETVQKDRSITTVTGEKLELNYAGWVYCIHYADAACYLIVNENNGNLRTVKLMVTFK